MARMTGGRAVVESLKAQGVDLLFGLISVHNLEITMHITSPRTASDISKGAWSRAEARWPTAMQTPVEGPGVLITSAGPGAAEPMGSTGEAYQSHAR